MTNEMIIWNARCALAEQGLIGSTGRKVEVKTADGEKVVMMEPTEIHTYAAWRDMGYQVMRGEKAVAKFRIWKRTQRRKRGSDEPEEKMIMTDAYFFSEDQVEKIRNET